MTTLIVIAKQPVPGRSKTRLNPPLSLEQAAQLAAACIDDTLAALSSAPASRRILFFEGALIPASAADLEVIAQPPGTLDERLAWLFDRCTEPTLLVGMDTPQLSATHLAPVLTAWSDEIDAWYGPATDGGFWALGMREPRGDLIRGVPMSQDNTGAMQLARLDSAGLRVGVLEQLTDVDTFADALAVAADAPHTRFARELGRIVASTTLPQAGAAED